MIFPQCDSLAFDESEYYYFPNLDINHIGSSIDCFYSNKVEKD